MVYFVSSFSKRYYGDKPKSLADYLVQAKLNRTSEELLQRGVSKCGSRRCGVCRYMDIKYFFVSTATGRKYSINYTLIAIRVM